MTQCQTTGSITVHREDKDSGQISGHYQKNGKKYYFFGFFQNGSFKRRTLLVYRKGSHTSWMSLSCPRGKETWKEIAHLAYNRALHQDWPVTDDNQQDVNADGDATDQPTKEGTEMTIRQLFEIRKAAKLIRTPVFVLGAKVELPTRSGGKIVEIRYIKDEQHVKIYWPNEAGGYLTWYPADHPDLMLA